MKTIIAPLSFLACQFAPLSAGLETGDQISVTLRGVSVSEQEKVNGTYRIGESGKVRLPLLEELVDARGLSPEQFARAAESAYRTNGIYTSPAIEVETLQGGDQKTAAIISVGGQVRRAGKAEYHKGMTVIQALDGSGGRNDFGSRNVLLLRAGKQYCLDFHNLKHKNIILQPGDSLQVEQKGIVDRWKGSERDIKELVESDRQPE
jgi:protein involved in polysaccharide export with SLBB domain